MKDSPGLVDGKLVRGTDCDTLFFKVLAGEEGQKKLDFRMFGNALRRMAQLRYPDLQVRKRRREAGKKQCAVAYVVGEEGKKRRGETVCVCSVVGVL